MLLLKGMEVMKKLIIASLLLAVTAITSGCCGKPMPHFADFKEVEFSQPQISDTQALVYFYRPGKFTGSAVNYYINDNVVPVGALKSGSFFYYLANPGNHVFWSETEEKSSVHISAIAGETYYVEGGVRMGMWIGVPSLTLVPEQVGKNAIQKLKYTELTKIPEKAYKTASGQQ